MGHCSVRCIWQRPQNPDPSALLPRRRPPMPILTLVVPQLKSNGLSWRLTGRSTARQCLVERGLLPVLAAPSPSGPWLCCCCSCAAPDHTC